MKSIRKFVALFTVLLLLGGLFPAAGGAFRPVPAQAASESAMAPVRNNCVIRFIASKSSDYHFSRFYSP